MESITIPIHMHLSHEMHAGNFAQNLLATQDCDRWKSLEMGSRNERKKRLTQEIYEGHPSFQKDWLEKKATIPPPVLPYMYTPKYV